MPRDSLVGYAVHLQELLKHERRTGECSRDKSKRKHELVERQVADG